MNLKPGDIISFYAEPSSMALRVPVYGTRRFCGEVVNVEPMQPFGPGAIPDANVKVRGRTGAEVQVSFVALYGQVHASWKEAEAACKQSSSSKRS